MSPAITVLLPVYNAQKFLKDAIESILNQTFEDFELLIIDDGSEDESPAIISGFADSRIRLIRQNENQGLIKTLNHGLGLANGKYIIRMDADDISLSHRFAKQFNFMEGHPEIGVCGSWIKAMNHPRREIFEYYISHEEIILHMFELVPFAHPSVIIRKSIIDKFKLNYNESYLHVEDYALWFDMHKFTKFANLPDVLIQYRFHDKQLSKRHVELQNVNADKIRRKVLEDLLNTNISEFEFLIHKALFHRRDKKSNSNIEMIKTWLYKLYKGYKSQNIISEKKYTSYLANAWYEACIQNTNQGIKCFILYFKPPFSGIKYLSVKQLFLLLIKSALSVKAFN